MSKQRKAITMTESKGSDSPLKVFLFFVNIQNQQIRSIQTSRESLEIILNHHLSQECKQKARHKQVKSVLLDPLSCDCIGL